MNCISASEISLTQRTKIVFGVMRLKTISFAPMKLKFGFIPTAPKNWYVEYAPLFRIEILAIRQIIENCCVYLCVFFFFLFSLFLFYFSIFVYVMLMLIFHYERIVASLLFYNEKQLTEQIF